MQLRLADPADAVRIQAIYAPIVEFTPISFEVEPPTVDEMARRITLTLPTYPWVVAEDQGRIAGYAYAGPHRSRAAYRWCVDVSVYVHADWRRRGVARSLYTALLRLVECQGCREAFAGIALPNPASVGLHEAMGFTLVGVYRRVGWKLGSLHDVGWWQRSLGSPDGEPAEPHSVDQLDPREVSRALT